MYNRILLMCLLFITVDGLIGQKIIQKDQSLSGIESIKFDFQWSDAKFIKSSDNQLHITVSVLINKGENDDAFELNLVKKGSILEVKSDIKDMENMPRYVVVESKGVKHTFRLDPNEDFHKRDFDQINWSEVNHWQGPDVLKEVLITVSIPENVQINVDATYGNLEIVNCLNPMIIENTYGHVQASFLSAPKDCKLKSTYSFVDISVPSSSSMDFDLHTNHGSIFTNLDIDIDAKKSKTRIFDNMVIGAINRGGKTLEVEATYSNIYLRKN